MELFDKSILVHNSLNNFLIQIYTNINSAFCLRSHLRDVTYFLYLLESEGLKMNFILMPIANRRPTTPCTYPSSLYVYLYNLLYSDGRMDGWYVLQTFVNYHFLLFITNHFSCSIIPLGTCTALTRRLYFLTSRNDMFIFLWTEYVIIMTDDHQPFEAWLLASSVSDLSHAGHSHP